MKFGGAKTYLATAVGAGSLCLAFGAGLLPGQKQMILPRGGKSVVEMLTREARLKPVAVEVIDLLKLPACFEQLRNFVSRVFNLSQYIFVGFLRVQYEDKEEIFLGPHSFMGVYEVTDELAGVETARSAGTRIRAREQLHVEAHLVGAINDRRFLSEPVEKLPTMSALGGISLQPSTPCKAAFVAGSLTEGPVDSEGRDRQPIGSHRWNVRKSPFSPGPQVLETTGAPRAVFDVRKRVDFRTGVAD